MDKRNVKQVQESRCMNKMEFTDARCHVEQAQAVLSAWLEATAASDRDLALIGAVMSLLEGVPEAMEEAETELAAYVMRDHREGKS
jgi:hypothetical protein